jgi:hypothetical protein
LYNLKGGGANGRPTEEARKKQSLAQMGRKHSEETKRNISLAKMGKKHKRNISLARSEK